MKRLLRSRITWLAVATIGLGLFGWWTLSKSRQSFNDSKPEDLTVAELIDRLADVSDEGIGTNSTAWASGFVAIDSEPRFRGGVFGSKPPVVHPVMRELVRRGVASLPDLLTHLSDSRSTRLKVGLSKGFFFTAKWHSDEYDYRFADPKQHPVGVNTSMEKWIKDEYTIRVGDLCYVIVGQIVNRYLSAVRYQPSACLVVNSPVETVALAEAVRKDWGGLTEEQHRESLMKDALQNEPYAASAALPRLCFYYPKHAEPLAMKLLCRPLYDYYKVRLFIKGKLIEGKGPNEWKQAVADFTKENGNAAAEALPSCLRDFVNEKTADRGEEFADARASAKKVLASLYPDFDPDRPEFFLNAVTEQDQTYLVEGLSGIRSDAVDTGVAQSFRSIDLTRYEKPDRVYADDLAIACMDRLIGKGFDNELRAYCERRIQELEMPQRTEAEVHRLGLLRERLNRIGNKD